MHPLGVFMADHSARTPIRSWLGAAIVSLKGLAAGLVSVRSGDGDRRTFVKVLLGLALAEVVTLFVVWPAFSLQVAVLLFAVANAALAAGALLGFLFGIPRFTARQAAEPQSGSGTADANSEQPAKGVRRSEPEYVRRTPLEDIADWLSKMVVGVGLVEARTLLHRFIDLCGYMSRAFATAAGSVAGSETNALGAVISGTVIVFHAVVGLIMAYTFCRLFLAGALTRANRQVEEILLQENRVVSEISLQSLEARQPTVGEKASARRIANLPVDQLQSAQDLAIWAKANTIIGERERAAEAYQRALALKPNDPRILRQYGRVLRALKKYKESKEQLKKAQTHADPSDHTLVDKIVIDLALTKLYLGSGSVRCALGLLERFGSNEAVADRIPRVLVLRASAYGLKHRAAGYLQGNATTLSEEARSKRERARRKALAAIVALAGSRHPDKDNYMETIRQLFKSDLRDFGLDPEFLGPTGSKPADADNMRRTEACESDSAEPNP
jgi:tetratricopeptide (TPR) repeat protein